MAGELHSYSEVCEALSTLEVALGFLAMTGGDPQMQLSSYLEEVLQMENQMAPHILKVGLSETPVILSCCMLSRFHRINFSSFTLCTNTNSKCVLGQLVLNWCGPFLCVRYEIELNDLPVLPTGLEHVLSKALCGSVAAAGLTQIRTHAASQEGKTLHRAYRWLLLYKSTVFFLIPYVPLFFRIHLRESLRSTNRPWVRTSTECWLASFPRTALTVSCWRCTNSCCWFLTSPMHLIPTSLTGGKTKCLYSEIFVIFQHLQLSINSVHA